MKRILTNNIIRSAKLYPDNIAFKQLDQSLNFKQLLESAYQIANALIQINVKKGDRVGVFMNRSFECAKSIYGIMFAGAAYVPIDSNLPANRIIELINDCDIKVIITNEQFKSKIGAIDNLPSSLRYVIGINEGNSDQVESFSWNNVEEFSTAAPDVSLEEDDIAYIIYTSGTTGKPKGIVHTHFSGFSYAKLSAELYKLDDKDILGNHSHLHYDISTLGYLTMPYVGGCTIIIPEAYTIFPTSLGDMIAKEKMTVWYSVPLAIIQLLNGGALLDKDLSALRWILFGGEIFATKHFKSLFELLPHSRFSNVYGPAEVNQCSFFNFDKNTVLEDNIPLGQAWPETHFDLWEPQKIGTDTVGELLVASSTRMQGYWNQEALTKNKLVVKSQVAGQEKIYYKTGDLVKKLEDGSLIFIGRKDRQIKVRGHRVELNEIENILLAKDTNIEVAAYAKKHEDAYQIYLDIVSSDDNITEVNIKKQLAKYLPKHALPEHYNFVDSIPRTGAGKVDYKLLSR